MVEGWKQTVANKPIEEIQQWRKKIIGKTKSKLCEEFMSALEKSIGMNVEREKPIGTKYVDGFIDGKLIVEFYGNYWHCNPAIYDKDDYILQHKKQIPVTYIWESDGKRNQYVLSIIDLPMIIVWEQSYINNKGKVIKEITNKFLKGEFKNGNIYVI